MAEDIRLAKGEDVDALRKEVENLSAYLSQINHRNIFRGKNLGSAVTEGQKAAIQSGTFDDLFVGDYWAIDGVNWRIVDMDYWMNSGLPTLSKHHLIIIPDIPLGESSMYETDTTSGGYYNSLVRQKLLDGEINDKINTAFPGIVLKFGDRVVSEVVDGKATAYQLNYASYTIPTEIMIYGANIYAQSELGVTVQNAVQYSKSQLSLFRLSTDTITLSNIWLRDVVSDTHFALLDGKSGATSMNASSLAGILPVFAIG